MLGRLRRDAAGPLERVDDLSQSSEKRDDPNRVNCPFPCWDIPAENMLFERMVLADRIVFDDRIVALEAREAREAKDALEVLLCFDILELCDVKESDESSLPSIDPPRGL